MCFGVLWILSTPNDQRKRIKFHTQNQTIEKFWIEWFGLVGGREIGTDKYPHRNWTDNPDDLLNHIKTCENEIRPIWITSQPFRHVRTDTNQYGTRKVGEAMAIEKLFFDFDDDTKYCKKCDKYIKKDDLIKNKKEKGSFCPHCKTLCKEQPRLDVVGEEVKKFLANSIMICKSQRKKFNPEPFVVETRKGYHVYFFLVELLTFKKTQFKFAKKLYKDMQDILIGGAEYEFMDKKIVGDFKKEESGSGKYKG